MHQYTRDEAGSLIISPCKQDTDQKCRKDLGILAIAIIGPVLVELLFRGAITKALLQQYSPTKAILLSALLFGVFSFRIFYTEKYG